MKRILPLFLAVPLLAKPIDLAETLRMVDGRNTQLAIAVEKLTQAEIDQKRAWYQWLPTLRAGYGYAEQNGPLQHTDGTISKIERIARSQGLGIAHTGSGLPAHPGISLEINLANASYDPKIAKHLLTAAEADKEETRFLQTMEAVEGYYNLVLAARSVSLHEKALSEASALAKSTGEFSKAGEGLEADADRASVEQSLRQYRLETAKFQQTAASHQLASLLNLSAEDAPTPGAHTLVPLFLFQDEQVADDLVQLALQHRPAIQALAARKEAKRIEYLKTKHGLLLPKVGAGYSYGEFGGREEFSSGYFDEREDTFVYLYWSLDNLGLGYAADVKTQASQARELKLSLAQAENDIALKILSTLANLKQLRNQLATLTQGLERARNGYRLSRQRIFQNQGLPLEALDAFKSLAEMEILHAQTIAKFNTTQLFLLGATGQEITLQPK